MDMSNVVSEGRASSVKGRLQAAGERSVMGSIEAVSGGYRGRGEVPQFHASPVQPPLGHLLGGAVREEQWTYVPKPGSMVPPCPCLVVPFSTPSHECSASLSSLRQEWTG